VRAFSWAGITLTLALGVTQSLADETRGDASTSPVTHADIGAEARYAEAVLAFHAQNHREAVRILQDVLKTNPRSIEALELQALSLKLLGQPSSALQTYDRLLKLTSKKDAHGPYQFEVGSILFQKGKYASARKFLRASLKNNFNIVASHFFLGLTEIAEKKFSQAEKHFLAILQSPKSEYSVAAHYYLGVTQMQLGAIIESSAQLKAAAESADQYPESALAQKVGKSATEALQAFDQDRWFAQVSTLGQSDSNVALLPNSILSTDATGTSSAKLTYSGAAGFMSSPLNTLQWVPSLRFSGNQNFNPEALESEFLSQQAVLFVTVHPLRSFHWGVRADGSFTFQNVFKTEGSTDSSYQPFSMTGDFGFFAKNLFSRQLSGQLDLYAKPQKFYTDLGTGTAQRSGYNLGAKSILRWNPLSRWLRPEVQASYERLNTEGSDFRGHQLTLDLTNGLRITDRQLLQIGVSVIRINYPEMAPTGRADLAWTTKASYFFPIGSKLTVLADLSYTSNTSTLPDAFSYKRSLYGLGLNWSL